MPAPTISAAYVSQCTVVETSGDPFVGTDNTVTINGMNLTETINAGTPIPATMHAAFTQALTAGAFTLDLTAFPGIQNQTLNGTGLKLRYMKLANPSTNANAITAKFGAANAYLALGAGWTIVIAPGQEILAKLDDDAPAIDGTHKNIDLSGTGSQALNIQLVLG